jgi:hypothetical protein
MNEEKISRENTICFTAYIYWEATGKILECRDCPYRDDCREEKE